MICLDVLRALGREPDALPALMAELATAKGSDKHYDALLSRIERELASRGGLDVQARRIAEHLGLAFQASLLLRHAPAFVADAFCAARLGGDAGHEYGTLPSGFDFDAIIERAFPAVN